MRVVIQAVPWDEARADNARHLAEQTGGTIVWDRDRSGYATFLRVLEEIGDDGAWVLEDDVDLCANWAKQAAQVVADHPGLVIRAFSLTTTCGLLPGLSYYALQCAYFPPGAARAILDFHARLPERVKREEALEQLHDHLVGLWLHATGQDYWLHTPSLVQHRVGVSLIDPAGRDVDRLSPTFESHPTTEVAL